MTTEKFCLGLFTSAWDEVAWELIREVHRSIQNGFVPNSEVAFVFCSRGEGETFYGDLMIRNVGKLGLPLITFSSVKFKPELRKEDRDAWRLEHDREIAKLISPTDLDVLLGYMWIVGQEMCRKRTMINLHPALPAGPKGNYRKVIWQLIKERARETGIMIHLVTPEVDRGPVVSHCSFSIRGGFFEPLWQEIEKRLEKESLKEIAKKEGENNSLFKAIRQEGVIRELSMIIWTIKTIAERRLKIENGKVIDAKGQVLEGGYDLTQEINAAIKERV